ncbi:MAG: RagB/SusD family nutrient uptake outer membrane protein [Saprospiraceae bacterium]|nr:RagB/SusD family nutrient uptake outer membrane protein [Saprospiraceae bacterium]
MNHHFFRIVTMSLLLFFTACKGLDTTNESNPDRNAVLASGADLEIVLGGGYVTWWQGVHGEHPVIGLSVAADAYGMSWGNFGAQRMGLEPRAAYNNRTTEDPDYRQIVETPWSNCLSAVSSANDVLIAMNKGISVDDGGPQDQSVKAAAHFLRGVSWGYLGLIFDQVLLANENTDIEAEIPFSSYTEAIDAAVAELEAGIAIAEALGDNFVHRYFNGLTLDATGFVRLSHSYAARLLAQWPRTLAENGMVNWSAVLDHAEAGLVTNFAPLADGKFWTSYQRYVFAEAGQGPFWARVDQRLIAALDPAQPTRYPEVVALGEAPLSHPMATSTDARLASDFLFFANNNFPVDRGEWHFSHYKHNRNITDAGFAGDGATSGPMPVFLTADNALLRAEALLRLNRKAEAINLLNSGTRVTRGQLPPLSGSATFEAVERAILYERAIELLSTAPMGLWFDRRRIGARQEFDNVDALGSLQKGTPAQLPVPAGELRIHGLPAYNFGGAEDLDGVVRVY